MTRIIGGGISISLDGCMAGPRQSADAPLGIGGERLHDWAWATQSMRALHGMEGGERGADDAWARRSMERVGATVIGRNMFGPARGAWGADPWRGWWGDDPPFHHPVFVLTHHARPPLAMEGGTTFHFVTGGVHAAVAAAREAAGDLDVRVGGGAETIRQCLAADLLDELFVTVVPILIGAGARPFDDGLAALPERMVSVHHEGTARVLHVHLARRSVDDVASVASVAPPPSDRGA